MASVQIDRQKDSLLPLFIWGALKAEEQLTRQLIEEGKDGNFPRSPGVFALLTPYDGMCCEVDIRCPAQFVNDSVGVENATPNIEIIQHAKPIELLDSTKGLQMFLQAKAIREIKAGEQIFLDYGQKFWDDQGGVIGAVELNLKTLEKSQFSDDEEEKHDPEEGKTIDLTGEPTSLTSGGTKTTSASSSSSRQSPASAKAATPKTTPTSAKAKKLDTPKSASALTSLPPYGPRFFSTG
jgi:hypothetical protein